MALATMPTTKSPSNKHPVSCAEQDEFTNRKYRPVTFTFGFVFIVAGRRLQLCKNTEQIRSRTVELSTEMTICSPWQHLVANGDPPQEGNSGCQSIKINKFVNEGCNLMNYAAHRTPNWHKRSLA